VRCWEVGRGEWCGGCGGVQALLAEGGYGGGVGGGLLFII